MENWPAHRLLMSRGGNIYTRLALGIPLRDATGGFRAFRMSALDRLDLPTVASQGYCFQVDLAWRAVQRGLRVVEVPITFVERVRGDSKMSGSIVRESLVRVTGLGGPAPAAAAARAGRPPPAQRRGDPMSTGRTAPRPGGSGRRRRLQPRQVLGLVLLGMLLVVAVEIAIAVLVSRLIGPWPTLLLIVAFSFAGLMVVRRGGVRSARALRDASLARRLPGGEMADAVMLLIGGMLMIPPGFLLDALGLLFVLPFTRPLVRRLSGLFLRVRLVSRFASAWPGGGPVIRGEVLHDEGEIGPGPHDGR